MNDIAPCVSTRQKPHCVSCGQLTFFNSPIHGLQRISNKLYCPTCVKLDFFHCSCGAYLSFDSSKIKTYPDPFNPTIKRQVCSSCFTLYIQHDPIKELQFDTRIDEHYFLTDNTYRLKAFVPSTVKYKKCDICNRYSLKVTLADDEGKQITVCNNHANLLDNCDNCNSTMISHPHARISSPTRTAEKLLCLSCRTDKIVLDCECILPKLTPHFIFSRPPIQGITDVDGITHANAVENNPTNMLQPGAHVCERHRLPSYSDRNRSVFSMNEYSYRPTWHEYRLLSESPEMFMMGIELEVDPMRSVNNIECIKQVTLQVGSRHVIAKRDGSVTRGIEFVTMPATFAYLTAERERYNKLLTIPRQLNYFSHDANTCGLHVHVTREYLKDTTVKHDGTIRLLWLTERFWPELYVFSRRSPKEACSWAKRFINGDYSGKDLTACEKLFDRLLLFSQETDRYRTLNFKNSDTLEFRLFRGTLNKTTFWATLQLVNNLVEIAKSHTDYSQLNSLTWKDIVRHNGYPELIEYSEGLLTKSHKLDALDLIVQHSTDVENKKRPFHVQIPNSYLKLDTPIESTIKLDSTNFYAREWGKRTSLPLTLSLDAFSTEMKTLQPLIVELIKKGAYISKNTDNYLPPLVFVDSSGEYENVSDDDDDNDDDNDD